MHLRIHPLSHRAQKVLEWLTIRIRHLKPQSGLAPSLSKGFAVVTVSVGFKVHETACLCLVSDRQVLHTERGLESDPLT